MLKLDYLIIGQGVAGSCLALKLIRQKKSFLLIDEDKHKASKVAVGIFNPVVLKRFAPIWDAEAQLNWLYRYFGDFEKLLGQSFINELPVYRIFKQADEIPVWKRKSKNEALATFIQAQIIHKQHPGISTPFGYAEVKKSGRIRLKECLQFFKQFLIEQNLYLQQRFDYDLLKMKNQRMVYKDITAERIVFCEGFGLKSNPLFNYLPLIGVKGEVLKIKTDCPVFPAVWKAFNFLLPDDEEHCYTASTYDRDDLTPEPTENGKRQILKHLKEIYTGDFEVIEHTAGIRPTVIDRRPLIGEHPEWKNVFLLNGMGTRGTLLAPRMTEFLYDFMEHQKPIPAEADLRRFDKLYYKN